MAQTLIQCCFRLQGLSGGEGREGRGGEGRGGEGRGGEGRGGEGRGGEGRGGEGRWVKFAIATSTMEHIHCKLLTDKLSERVNKSR